MTLRHLTTGGGIDAEDFLIRQTGSLRSDASGQTSPLPILCLASP